MVGVLSSGRHQALSLARLTLPWDTSDCIGRVDQRCTPGRRTPLYSLPLYTTVEDLSHSVHEKQTVDVAIGNSKVSSKINQEKEIVLCSQRAISNTGHRQTLIEAVSSLFGRNVLFYDLLFWPSYSARIQTHTQKSKRERERERERERSKYQL